MLRFLMSMFRRGANTRDELLTLDERIQAVERRLDLEDRHYTERLRDRRRRPSHGAAKS